MKQTTEEIKAELQRLSAEIGMIEIKRQTGVYHPMNDLITKRNKFGKLAKIYMKLKKPVFNYVGE